MNDSARRMGGGMTLDLRPILIGSPFAFSSRRLIDVSQPIRLDVSAETCTITW
ncbi:MAG: hypothetical protein OSB26_08505 [Woeseiaceae bacterium]|nr:hypothetical protein [Woeseiaceae bacterium]